MRLLCACCFLASIVVPTDGQEAVSIVEADSSSSLLDAYREKAIEKWESHIAKLEGHGRSRFHILPAVLGWGEME